MTQKTNTVDSLTSSTKSNVEVINNNNASTNGALQSGAEVTVLTFSERANAFYASSTQFMTQHERVLKIALAVILVAAVAVAAYGFFALGAASVITIVSAVVAGTIIAGGLAFLAVRYYPVAKEFLANLSKKTEQVEEQQQQQQQQASAKTTAATENNNNN